MSKKVLTISGSLIPILLCLICMASLVVLAGCSSRPHSSSTTPTSIPADMPTAMPSESTAISSSAPPESGESSTQAEEPQQDAQQDAQQNTQPTSSPPAAMPSTVPSKPEPREESQPQAAPPTAAIPSGTPLESAEESSEPGESNAREEADAKPTINIQIGSQSFTATLYANASAEALLEKLPLTLNMDELNGNEKFYFFSESLPAASQRVGNIKAGDLMLYGVDCLVLFYESFATSYSYTRLGYIEDVTGLADVLGSGSVEVTFSAGH